MTNREFGKDIDVFEQLVTYLVQLKASGPPLDGWEIAYFIRKFYDELFSISERCYIVNQEGRYEIKQFSERTDPLRMVSKTTTEGLMEDDAYRRRAWEFRTYNIGEIQKMSFNEWMAQPPARLEAILNDIRKEKALMESQTPPPPVNEMSEAEKKAYYRDMLIRGSKAV